MPRVSGWRRAVRRIRRYILWQLQEPSTWRGLTLIATGIGVRTDPDRAEAIISAGVIIAGLIGAAFPDRTRYRRYEFDDYREGWRE